MNIGKNIQRNSFVKAVNWSAGVVIVAVAFPVASCGNGDVDDSSNSSVALTSLEPTGGSVITPDDPSPTVATGDVTGDGDVVQSDEPTKDSSDDLKALVEELLSDEDVNQQNEGRGSIDGRAVEPGYQERYPSDPMDNPTTGVTRTLNIPGEKCMDSELGEVREHRSEPVTCAKVGDGPQWVQGEPYW